MSSVIARALNEIECFSVAEYTSPMPCEECNSHATYSGPNMGSRLNDTEHSQVLHNPLSVHGTVTDHQTSSHSDVKVKPLLIMVYLE